MKVSHFLLIPLVSVLPAIVSATCYKSGEKWDREQAIAAVDKACAALVGDYPGGKAKVSNIEIDVKPKKCYHFVLRRLGNTSRNIEKAECKSGMLHEVTGCDRGGSTGYDNWAYIADPNSGACPKKSRRNLDEEDFEDDTE
ncbi:MAG: hypothetical protein L6R39_000845 [Caloplaca ligustica]|nr:MAG: hypothetical protein L6R39_000845 [Caloplaca ligustica]